MISTNELKQEGICLLEVCDVNRDCGYRLVDVGWFYIDNQSTRYLLTTYDIAKKYHKHKSLKDVVIIFKKNNKHRRS